MIDLSQSDSDTSVLEGPIGTASMQAGKRDPIRSRVLLPLRGVFYPLGFGVEISTNAQEVLDAAEMSWGGLMERYPREILQVQIVVAESDGKVCPPAPVMRGQRHILSIVSDADNQAICDLETGIAFAWLNRSALEHLDYLRYHFIEAIALVLISARYLTPLHAACVSLHGHGMLLCGDSGAGKSSLAYACARAGWTFTSDDASYLLRDDHRPKVIGNSRQVRFRPSAKDLFPELEGRNITPRAKGKPSIEVPTSELPVPTIAAEATVHSIIFLNRQSSSADAELVSLDREVALRRLHRDLYPTDHIQTLQAEALGQLASAEVFELRYHELEDAVECLEVLANIR